MISVSDKLSKQSFRSTYRIYGGVVEIPISVYFEGHRRQEQQYDFKLFITNNFYGCGMVELEDLIYLFHGHTEILHNSVQNSRKHWF